eukprot:12188065-Karenia_brevis.AAC.1
MGNVAVAKRLSKGNIEVRATREDEEVVRRRRREESSSSSESERSIGVRSHEDPCMNSGQEEKDGYGRK